MTDKLEALQCGYLYNYISKFNKGNFSSAFYLKETDLNISEILKSKTIEMKTCSLLIDGQACIALLFRFANKNKLIYSRIYNVLSHSDREHLEMLLFQSEIELVLVSTTNIIYSTLVVENDFKNNIKEYILKPKNLKTEFKNDGAKLNLLWDKAY